MDDLTWASAAALSGWVAARKVSPVEVVEACLRRIDTLEPALHSMLSVCGDRAMAQARTAADAVSRGRPLGPLHGVPVALKDEAWTEGVPSTGGSLIFRGFVPKRDGTVAERLRAAGAIIVGKTALPEFASWPRSKTRLQAESVNPWDPTRISGASSGGSAAAVAAGLVPIAIGSDGGGSTRIPSALCGTVGLYPTAGRVPSYGSFSYSPAGSLGPIAREVRDVALVQNVISGPDPRDAWASTKAAEDVFAGIDDPIPGIRIGWTPDFGHITVQSGIAAAAREAMEVLLGIGAVVETVTETIDHPWGNATDHAERQAEVAARASDLPETLPEAPDVAAEEGWMWSVFSGSTPFTGTDGFHELCQRHSALLAPYTQVTQARGRPRAPDTQVRQKRLRRTMASLFERYDVICSPTMAMLAPVASRDWGTPYPDPFMGTNFTFVVNAVGATAATVPCGLVDGLPVGIQVIGPAGQEATVLRVCRAYERALATSFRPPLALAA